MSSRNKRIGSKQTYKSSRVPKRSGVRDGKGDKATSSLLVSTTVSTTSTNDDETPRPSDPLQNMFHLSPQLESGIDKDGTRIANTIPIPGCEGLGGVLGAMESDEPNLKGGKKKLRLQRRRRPTPNQRKQEAQERARKIKNALSPSPKHSGLDGNEDDSGWMSEDEDHFLEGDVLVSLGRLSIDAPAKEVAPATKMDDFVSVLVGGKHGKENGNINRAHKTNTARNNTNSEADDLGSALVGGIGKTENPANQQKRRPLTSRLRYGNKQARKPTAERIRVKTDKVPQKSALIVPGKSKSNASMQSESSERGGLLRGVLRFTPKAKDSRKRHTATTSSCSQTTADLTPLDFHDEKDDGITCNLKLPEDKSPERFQRRPQSQQRGQNTSPLPTRADSAANFASFLFHSPQLVQRRKKPDLKPTPFRFDLGDYESNDIKAKTDEGLCSPLLPSGSAFSKGDHFAHPDRFDTEKDHGAALAFTVVGTDESHLRSLQQVSVVTEAGARQATVGTLEMKHTDLLSTRKIDTPKRDPSPFKVQPRVAASTNNPLCKPDPPSPLIRLRQTPHKLIGVKEKHKPDPPAKNPLTPAQRERGGQIQSETGRELLTMKESRDPTPRKHVESPILTPTSHFPEKHHTFGGDDGPRADFEATEVVDCGGLEATEMVDCKGLRNETSLSMGEAEDMPSNLDQSTEEDNCEQQISSSVEVCYFDVEDMSRQPNSIYEQDQQQQTLRTDAEVEHMPAGSNTRGEIQKNGGFVPGNGEYEKSLDQEKEVSMPSSFIPTSEDSLKKGDIKEEYKRDNGTRKTTGNLPDTHFSRRSRKEPDRFGSYATEEEIERKLRPKKKKPLVSSFLERGMLCTKNRTAEVHSSRLGQNSAKSDMFGASQREFASCDSGTINRQRRRRATTFPSNQMTYDSSENDSAEGTCDWMEAEVEQLRKAHSKVDPTATFYWDRIATFLNGRTAEECRSKWFSLVATPKPRKATYTGGMDQGMCEDIDDIFDSSPQFRRSSLSRNCGGYTMNLGSPITFQLPRGQSQTSGVISQKAGNKSYIAALKRAVKQKQKSKCKTKTTKPRSKGRLGTLSESVRDGDFEIKASMTPGGTLRVNQVHCPEDQDGMDDFWDEEYE